MQPRKDISFHKVPVLCRIRHRLMQPWTVTSPCKCRVGIQNMEMEEKTMARKRVTEPQLTSWEQVDECLKVMSDAENQITVIEAEMNAAIAEAKKEAEEKAARYKELIKQNEGKIKEYTTINKEELKGKSRQLTFGTVGFRQSTKLLLPSDTAEVILKLRENGMVDCINVKETINKDTVKTYPEAEILKIGGYLQKTDTFWYETDKDSLAEAAQ